MRAVVVLMLVSLASGCRATGSKRVRVRPPLMPISAEACAERIPLKVHFFDVAQALAVLVELPGGETILVDTGESPTRPGCGAVCNDAHEHLTTG